MSIQKLNAKFTFEKSPSDKVCPHSRYKSYDRVDLVI